MSRQRWIAVALLVSLLMNGAVLGLYLAGRLGAEQRGLGDLSRHLLRGAPEEFRESMRDTMLAHRGEARAAFRELRAARQALNAVLAQQSADTAALQTAFARTREADANLKAVMHTVLSEVLPTIPAVERVRLAEQRQLRHKKAKEKCRPEEGQSPP